MQREISYEFSPALVRLAARRFIVRYAGAWLALSIPIMILGVAWLTLGTDQPLWWLAVILPAGFWALWVRHYLTVAKICDTMSDRRISVRVDDDSITLQSADGQATMRWSSIKRLWRFPEVLLLFWHRKDSNYSILPVETLGSELAQFIQDKVREHGGEVA